MNIDYVGFHKKYAKKHYRPFKFNEKVFLLVEKQYKLLAPTKKKSFDYRLWVKPKGKPKILIYKNMTLTSKVSYQCVPEFLPDVKGRRTKYLIGKKIKYIAVTGIVLKKKNKEWFIATDMLEYDNKKNKYKPIDGVNRFLALSLLAGKGFRTVPYWLTSQLGPKGMKTKNFKDICKVLIEQAKIQGIDKFDIVLSNLQTRETIAKKRYF